MALAGTCTWTCDVLSHWGGTLDVQEMYQTCPAFGSLVFNSPFGVVRVLSETLASMLSLRILPKVDNYRAEAAVRLLAAVALCAGSSRG